MKKRIAIMLCLTIMAGCAAAPAETGLTDTQAPTDVDFISDPGIASPDEEETFPQPEGGRKFETNWAVAGSLAEIYYEEEVDWNGSIM